MLSFLSSLKTSLIQKKVKRKFSNGEYKLESVLSCLCGSENLEPVAYRDSFGFPIGVTLCKRCGLGLLNPKPEDETLRQFYERDYRALYRGSSSMDDGYFMRSHRRGKKIYEYIEAHRPDAKINVVAEVGCGPGGILKYFQERGKEAYGCEFDSECVKLANSKGVKTFFGGVETMESEGVRADLLILSHLVEHISDPDRFLKQAEKIMADGAIVYVEVPGLRNKSNNFFSSVQIAHLYYYDLTTLSSVMGKNGFNMLCGDEAVRSLFTKGDCEKVILDGNYEKNIDVIESWKN
ncbi:hypothetical protein MNBD_NITROSPINAE04-1072 [hydrothermal vent metagenome]|uniref:Methyltransferase type 11 n=1 Tax=hydrothermal vent metagenome TaxID=652676 RepID=A0A3B1C7C8_9ZZZZ